MRFALVAVSASLAAIAPIAFAAAPAAAQSSAASGFNLSSSKPFLKGVPADRSGVRVHRGFGFGRDECDFRDRRRDFGDDHDGDGRRHRRDRRDRRIDCGVVFGGYAPEAWALYNNRSWDSDSYNDWWHDQPWRSYPRWVKENQRCERVWYSGSGWRC